MDDKQHKLHTESVQGASGRLLFNQHITQKSKSNAVDYSCVELSQQDGANLKLIAGGKARIQAVSDLSLNSKKDTFFNVEGNRQDIIGLDHLALVKGDVKILAGSHNKEAKDNAEKLVNLSSTINKSAQEAAKAVEDEEIPCPSCECKTAVYNSGEDAIILFRQSRNWISEQLPFMASAFSILDTITSLVALPYRMIKMGVGRNKKTNSCGPGCKGGKVKTLRKSVQESVKTRNNLIQLNTENINKLHRDIGSGGNFIASAAGAVYLQSGLRRNDASCYLKKGRHSHPYRWVQGDNVRAMTYSTDGNCEQVIYTKPISLTKGEMLLNCSELLTIKAGAPGIDVETPGIFALKSGSIEMLAAEGEAHLGSGNLTLINGANVRIVGKGKGGDDGISLEADKIMLHGALSVKADLAVKGHISTDGEVATTFLNVPGMSQEVTAKEPTQTCTGVQNLLPQVTRSAHVAVKSTAVHDYGEIATIRGAVNLMREYYDLTMSSTGVDPKPSGYVVLPPAIAYLINPSWNVPIYNYWHNHSLNCLKTSGSVVVPKGTYSMTNAGVYASRSVANHVPVPARTEGTFPSGGPGTQPGPCGGGGLFAKKMEARNLAYGVDPIDPFQGTNMIDRYNQNSSLVTNLTGSTGFFPPVENPPFSFLEPVQTDKDKLDC